MNADGTDPIAFDEVRVICDEEGRVYVSVDDFQMALQYDVACNLDELRKMENANPDAIKTIESFADMICEAMEELKGA